MLNYRKITTSKKLLGSHSCQLPSEEDIVVRYIDSGFFVELRRKIKNLTVVDEDNPRSKECLKSRAAIRQEKRRHLQYYYYMIHPFSIARVHWEFFMMFVFLAALIIIPIEISTLWIAVWYIKIPMLFVDIICCFDIGVTFCTGYYQKQSKKIILNQKRVAKHYLSGYFIIDLVTSLPIDFVCTVLFVEEEMWYLKLVSYLKIMRMSTLSKYLDYYRDWKDYSLYKFKVFKLVIIYMLVFLWASSFVYLLAMARPANTWILPKFKNSPFKAFAFSCFKSVYMLLRVGYGDRPCSENLECVYQMVCLTVGMIMFLFMLGQILQILIKYNSSRNKYQQLIKQVNEYMKYKQLPESMKKRIYTYFDFKYQKHFYKEKEILSTITVSMRQEILLHNSRRLVEKVDFLRNLPPALLTSIVSCLKMEIFLPNDVIVHSGVAGDTMFFICSGTVAVFTQKGKELCHLSDGANFGEIALVMPNENRVATVIAVDCCDLLSLSRKDFQKAIEPYPELLIRIKKLAQERLKKIDKIMSANASLCSNDASLHPYVFSS